MQLPVQGSLNAPLGECGLGYQGEAAFAGRRVRCDMQASQPPYASWALDQGERYSLPSRSSRGGTKAGWEGELFGGRRVHIGRKRRFADMAMPSRGRSRSIDSCLEWWSCHLSWRPQRALHPFCGSRGATGGVGQWRPKPIAHNWTTAQPGGRPARRRVQPPEPKIVNVAGRFRGPAKNLRRRESSDICT